MSYNPDDYECECGDDDCPKCNLTCHYCHGECCGIVGTDWDCDDGINGPYDGEIAQCPCCGGSGKASDCAFW